MSSGSRLASHTNPAPHNTNLPLGWNSHATLWNSPGRSDCNITDAIISSEVPDISRSQPEAAARQHLQKEREQPLVEHTHTLLAAGFSLLLCSKTPHTLMDTILLKIKIHKLFNGYLGSLKTEIKRNPGSASLSGSVPECNAFLLGLCPKFPWIFVEIHSEML